MTVTAMRTNAEQALAKSFEAVATKLPGGEAVRHARRAAMGRFAALGLPHRRIEEWKYTDLRSTLKEALPPAVAERVEVRPTDIDRALRHLAGIDACRVVFVDGAHRPDLSRSPGVKGLDLKPLAETLTQAQDKLGQSLAETSGPEGETVLALNTAFMTDGAIVRVAPKTVLEKPLLLVFARAAREGRLVTTRNVVSIGAGARVTLIEAYVTLPGAVAGQANTATEIVIGEGADVSHLKCTLEGPSATHLASWVAGLGAGCAYRVLQFTAETGLVRNQAFITFHGHGAKLDFSGCLLGRGSEHVDTTLLVDHAAPGGESRELMKAVLDERARGVFQAKVIVRPGAQKTDGKQMAQALMLSENTEFDSKPELEIYADDVVCGHGSTCAEIDPAMLFYLRARGIPVEEARALLIESFVGEAIAKIENEPVREAVFAFARDWLGKSRGQEVSV